ncbi:hypothetical protein HOF92_08765 [bacterium]|jgi:endonuclease/exonuclease/phosphatase family metal-dependent hydrolase|nr:hypothetical protein [bacterium]
MKLLPFLLTLCVSATSMAKSPVGVFENLYPDTPTSKGLRIMNFNTYFLYDMEDDPNVEKDQEFKPSDYTAKLKGIADAINRNSPDVVGLQEVENLRVLKDLNTYLNRNYNILHYESRDSFTGQDVALLYDRTVLAQASKLRSNLRYSANLLDRKGKVLVKDQTLTKGILEVSLKVKATNEVLTFLVVHLKSQLGGFTSDMKRIAQANTLRQRMDEILQAGKKKIFLLGDFNDINPSAVIKMVTGESRYEYDYDAKSQVLFYDLLVDYSRKDNFTYKHQKFLKAGNKFRYLGTFYSRIDYIFASPWVKDRSKDVYIDQTHSGDVPSEEFRPEDERVVIGSNGEVEIFNSDRFPSDHYPVIINYKIN